MKLYTGLGDQGSTDLLGERVGKDDPRIELIGTLDEVTSSIGFARSLASVARSGEWLLAVQRDLYRIMAELAFTDEMRPDSYRFSAERVEWLSASTDIASDEIELPRHFIIPGETTAGAALDVARAISRRAERLAVVLHHAGRMNNPEILRYLNRLSSLLFVLARVEEAASGTAAIPAKTPRTRS
jgi:cob(I)alamin adenosyltransferase